MARENLTMARPQRPPPLTNAHASSHPDAASRLTVEQRNAIDLLILGQMDHAVAATVGVARETGCEMLVTLGALLADVPHTRPTRLTGTAIDPELIARLGLSHSRYEGPTGIVGVLHDACREAGMPSVSLWAPVPHYVASPPNPKATRALLERLSDVLSMPIGLGDLAEAAVAWEARVNELVGSDADIAAYVRQLEERDDDQIDEHDLPSGDSLAAELERFLRDQRPRD